MLTQYKEQSCVESGFKFIKNDAFELDSFFLKTPIKNNCSHDGDDSLFDGV